MVHQAPMRIQVSGRMDWK